jgi:hypothetical protein
MKEVQLAGKKPGLWGDGFIGQFEQMKKAKPAKPFPVTWQQAMSGKTKQCKEKEDD